MPKLPHQRHLKNWRSLILPYALHPDRFIASLTAGLICGEMSVIYAISFATIIFSGDLSAYLAAGIGLALFTAITASIIVALMSSLAGVATMPQEAPAVILGLIAAAIVAQLPPDTDSSEILYTVLMAIGLTSILSGIFCFVLGHYKLGEITRAIPYSVVGGFLAGTGWLLSSSALSLMAGIPLGFAQIPQLLQPQILICWMPGTCLALLLLVVLRRYQHVLILPGMVLGAMLLFYVVLFATQTSIPVARGYGLLLNSFPEGGLWQPLQPAIVLQANWGLIVGQIGQVMSVVMLTAIALLLNCTGIELASGQDIDLNQELRAVGVANIVAGLGGGMIGFHSLGLSTLSLAKVRAESRLVGLIAAAVCAATLFAGESMIALVPKPVLGGVALFLGLNFLVEWVYDSWFRLSKSDYCVIILILIAIATIGFLQGVAFGLGAAILLAVIHYSRTHVIRTVSSGMVYAGKGFRPPRQRQVLGRERDQIRIFELQGFLFFGNASKLLSQICEQIRHPEFLQPRFVVLNFDLVKALDASAALTFAKLEQIAQQHQQTLVFTHLSSSVQRKLQIGGCFQAQVHQLFPTLEQGLAWCEDQILACFLPCYYCPLPLDLCLDHGFWGTNHASILMEYLEEREVDAGSILFRRGDPGEQVYFVALGQVDLLLEFEGDQENGQAECLRSLQVGDLIGEVEFYHQSPYLMTAIASQTSRLYCLSRTAWRQLKHDHPEVASAWQEFVILCLSDRLMPADAARINPPPVRQIDWETAPPPD